MSGLSGVYIVSPDGNAVFQMVQTGEPQGEMIEAVSGLKAGDKVILTGQAMNIDGRKVMIAQK
jgi:multidrug efflux pump subunit AcrA (membrane-fusion protein)